MTVEIINKILVGCNQRDSQGLWYYSYTCKNWGLSYVETKNNNHNWWWNLQNYSVILIIILEIWFCWRDEIKDRYVHFPLFETVLIRVFQLLPANLRRLDNGSGAWRDVSLCRCSGSGRWAGAASVPGMRFQPQCLPDRKAHNRPGHRERARRCQSSEWRQAGNKQNQHHGVGWVTAAVIRAGIEDAEYTADSQDVTPLSPTTRQCFSDLQEAPSGNRSQYRTFFRYPAAGAAQRHLCNCVSSTKWRCAKDPHLRWCVRPQRCTYRLTHTQSRWSDPEKRKTTTPTGVNHRRTIRFRSTVWYRWQYRCKPVWG